MANPGSSLTKDNDLIKGTYTDEEKREIMATIDKVVEGNRLGGDEGNLIRFPAQKRGILFPLMVNLLAVGLVVSGWFFADWFFKNKVEGLKERTNQIFSTEGRLLAKLMEESKAQLDAKNKELEKIQGDLSNVESQKNKLLQEFDSKLNAKEEELKASLAQQLEAERQRLKGQGVSESDIAARLKSLEAQKAQETQRVLDEFRKANQAEIDVRNRELDALKSRLNAVSVDQEKLKADLEAKAKERESSLQSQLSKQGASLDRLTKESDAERLFNRQIETELAGFQTAMEHVDYGAAIDSLAAVDSLATKGLDSEFDSVKKRAQADRSLATTLTKTVRDLQGQAGKVAPDPIFQTFKFKALKAAEIKDPTERAQAYGAAAEMIPEVQSVVKALRDYNEQKLAAGYAEKLRQAEGDLKAAGSLAEQLAALKLQNEALTSQVSDLQTQLAALETTSADADALQARIDDLEKQLAAGPVDSAALKAQIADLEAKLALSTTGLSDKEALWQKLMANYQTAREQVPTLLATPTADSLAQADAAFVGAFSTPEGVSLFPGFAESYQSLLDTRVKMAKDQLTAAQAETALANSQLQAKLTEKIDPLPFREKAFGDVLTLTSYLSGESDRALAARDFVAEIAKNEPKFKAVADAIQGLAERGAKETLIRTVKTGLLGPLVSLTGTKGVAEIFTRLKPEIGQLVEIRRNSSSGDLVTAQGKVSAATDKRVDIDITAIPDDKKKPISGDVVYLELK